MWQDNEVRFDISHFNMQLRSGELTVDKLDMIEDTKGNAGDLGKLIVTNLRILWHSLSFPRINLSIGYNTFVTVNTKILHTVRTILVRIFAALLKQQAIISFLDSWWIYASSSYINFIPKLSI